MAITYDEAEKVFHLQTRGTSYVMGVVQGDHLAHLYWGRRIARWGGSNAIVWKDRGLSPNPSFGNRKFSLDTCPQEYPQTGNGDFRSPAYVACQESGGRTSNLLYEGYEVVPGKPALPGLPASFGSEDEVETLVIHMADEVSGLHADLQYSVFERADVITRSVRFENDGAAPIKLEKMLSFSVDFRDDDFDVLTLYGAHVNERNMDRRPLTSGIVSVESTRGVSSAQQSPFMALLRPDATEDTGEVYAADFVYSGNFIATAQVDPFRCVRFQMGMSPWCGSWLLEAGETFQTPEVLLVHSARGLNGMSQTFHAFLRSHLMHGEWADELRPILINNWEATECDFTEDQIVAFAERAAKAGFELFVLDDGWFGHRDDDTTSLGDWFVNERKLPHGLAHLSERIHDMGLKFGLWFEPEMVSVDSELYRAHPDWAMHAPGRPHTFGRDQLVLDLTRPEVCDYIVKSVASVLESAQIDYVKWDMNRHLTEVESEGLPPERQGEVFHRYVLGLYRILGELTARFPHILWESCASGGSRFDAGMLYYMPQTWTSDNTDAICRTKIQYSTSLIFPPVTMGAHASAVPNYQTGRVTPLATRGIVAMGANFGYELDLGELSEGELEEVREQIELYKQIRPVVQRGTLFRGSDPFCGNEASWTIVSEDGSCAVATWVQTLSMPEPPIRTLKLKGLDADARYRDRAAGAVYGGDELMYAGLSIQPKKQDFRAEMWVFDRL